MKRLLSGILALSLALLLLPGAVQAAGEEAEDLTGGCTFSATAGPGNFAALTDASLGTAWTADGAGSLSISAKAPIGGLYLIWNKLPAMGSVYQVKDGVANQVATYGEKGFLHEYIDLTGAGDRVELAFGQAGASLAKVTVLGKGETPSWVQKWDEPYEKADMLVLPTHADDEHLWFGGTMPYYAGELGKKVQVAYLTYHVVGREHELLNGLWTVGIRAYPVISAFEDIYASKASLEAAKQVYGEENVLRFQVELLRRFRPDVVIGHDLKGEYGHGMHMLNALTLIQALELSGKVEVYPEQVAQYGVWDVPKCYIHLYKENPVVMDWDRPLTAFGGKSAYEVAVEGYACHVSQQPYFQMHPDGTYSCKRFGLFRSTVGPDVQKDDFFENITAQPEKAESSALEEVSEGTSQVAESSRAEAPQTEGEKGQAEKLLPYVAIGFLGLLAILGVGWFCLKRRKKPGKRIK